MKYKLKMNLFVMLAIFSLFICIPVDRVANAADMFLKIVGVDGEATDDAHDQWIELTSYQGRKASGMKARIKGKVLLLKDRKGRYGPAKAGEYKLKDGRIISVMNGKIHSKRLLHRQMPTKEK